MWPWKLLQKPLDHLQDESPRAEIHFFHAPPKTIEALYDGPLVGKALYLQQPLKIRDNSVLPERGGGGGGPLLRAAFCSCLQSSEILATQRTSISCGTVLAAVTADIHVVQQGWLPSR